MAAGAAAVDRSVSVGRVFGRAFASMAGNPLATFAIAFLFGGLPTTALVWAVQTYGSTLGPPDALSTIGADLASYFGAAAITSIAQGGLVRLVIAHGEGGKSSFGDSIGSALAVALPLVAMAILSSLGIVLGLIFLIVPGMMLAISWTVASSALVEERLGPIASLRRSRQLAAGARWKVFALLMTMFAATTLANVAFERLGGHLNLAEAGEALPNGSALIHLAVYACLHTAAIAAWGLVQTSLYVELRTWKEGPATEALADIFG
jgi:hypothetical protein